MKRPRLIAAAVVVVLAGGVTAIVLATTGGVPLERAPKPVLGQPVHALVVYEHPRHPGHTAGPGERAIPVLPGRNLGLPTVVKEKPVIALHVDYARVIPSDPGWRITFEAQESDAFNDRTAFPNTFAVLINGKATNLLFFPYDGVNYEIGVDNEFPKLGDALAVAHSLTTSVTVAHCTAEQIAKYKCT